jgi:hypothetical protein
MDTLGNEPNENTLRVLTADQRQQIYEEEKSRLEQFAPKLSKNAKVQIAVYIFGCVLVYFGIAQSLLEFATTGQWSYSKPETNLFMTLFNAVWILAGPLAAGYLFGVPCYVVVYLLWTIKNKNS